MNTISLHTSLIQQPELHLHPALQAALGDVFIEAMNNGKRQIIETHSEHLILRILKRVRQTSRGHQTLPPQLNVKPDDLVILYFDPVPAGSTSVIHLRLDRDGDFLDRWPHGFFGDREKEFDDE